MLKNKFGALLDKKPSMWDSCKTQVRHWWSHRFPPSPPLPPGVPVTCAFGQAQTRMEEMSQYFSGEMALTRVTKDEQLQVWSSNGPARRAWRAMQRARGVRCNARVACDATRAWRAMQRARVRRQRSHLGTCQTACNARVADKMQRAAVLPRAWAALDWAAPALGWTGRRLRWAGLRWAGVGRAGVSWAGLGWSGLGWTGLGWAGLDWAGLGWTAGVVCEHRVGSERSRVRRSAAPAMCIGSWHSPSHLSYSASGSRSGPKRKRA